MLKVNEAINVINVRHPQNFDGSHLHKGQHGGSQMAWMDLEGSTLNRFKSRTSGDGASIEALDSNVFAFKKEAESDQQFLNDEMEYLKNIQGINIRTLSKYQ